MATRATKASPTVKASSTEASSDLREPTMKSTPARKTTVPPKTRSTKSAAKPVEVTREMIAERAYHLWQSGAPGGEFDHWCAAERELNGK